jgi:two-component system sensor histidine kinase KdpD
MSSRGSARWLVWARTHFLWQRYVVDSVWALSVVSAITGLIAFLHIYPRISTVSLIYLLIVLLLAALRGRVAAILTAVLAFCAFNFFLVPPLYTFAVGKPDELVALFVFLATAIITGQLASALRARAEEASRREQETHILYELGRAVTSEDELAAQLAMVVRAVVDVFSVSGVQYCGLLLPDADGTLQVQAQATRPMDGGLEPRPISAEEQAAITWVMHHHQTVDVYEGELSAPQSGRLVRIARGQVTPFVRLVPLLSNEAEAIGVLRLLMEGVALLGEAKNTLGTDRSRPGSSSPFFWTFVDQITFLLVRVRLRSAHLHIQALQETDKLRAALVSSVSHDLRTPLATMKAATSSLLSDGMQWDEETRRSFLLSIEGEIDRLNRFVGNLLDLSRIEGNALKPEKEWYLIDELIRDVIDHIQPHLAERHLSLGVPDDLPPVKLDYLALDQVLTNVIENAISYTPAGTPIEIDAQVKGGQMEITIADRGPGIPPADLERIFDKFYRVQGTRRDRAHCSGSGLGLAVCQGLVEAHGGQIRAENREGGGALFRITLPMDPSSDRLEEVRKGGSDV